MPNNSRAAFQKEVFGVYTLITQETMTIGPPLPQHYHSAGHVISRRHSAAVDGSLGKSTIQRQYLNKDGVLVDISAETELLVPVENVLARTRGAEKFQRKRIPEDFYPGDIIEAPWVVPNLDHKFSEDVVWSRLGWICAKVRPMIVHRIYHGHLLALPIFSSGGNGLTNKPSYLKAEAVSVKEYDDSIPTESEPCLESAPDTPSWTPKHGAYVRMNQPLVVDYGFEIAIVGKLTESSTVDFLSHAERSHKHYWDGEQWNPPPPLTQDKNSLLATAVSTWKVEKHTRIMSELDWRSGAHRVQAQH